eukprot:6474709-Amphidinium_carterae.1
MDYPFCLPSCHPQIETKKKRTRQHTFQAVELWMSFQYPGGRSYHTVYTDHVCASLSRSEQNIGKTGHFNADHRSSDMQVPHASTASGERCCPDQWKAQPSERPTKAA